MKELIKKANNTHTMKHLGTFDDGTKDGTDIYGIETDNYRLEVWNSSNHSDFDHQETLKEIINYLLDDELEGNFTDSWMHEIMFEVKVK